ncbi:MAG: DNRLRE domain-containing protein, partial [Chitinivibrionales bacterium]|nr:DNRLRE domain-containing protein [Chitinivibrionales bacterium]
MSLRKNRDFFRAGILITICCVGLILLFPGISYGALYVPLHVEDYAGIERVREPVTSGIPIPEEERITSVSRLAMTDAQGVRIPAQFSVLSRWKGAVGDTTKPIKWVLVDFQADVTGNGNAVYYLDDSGSNIAPQKPVSVREDDNGITVSTGTAEFYLSKNYFNVFDRVVIDRDGDGAITDRVFSSAGEGGLVLLDTAGKIFRSNLEPPEEIVVEESGPLRAVVKIRGVFKSQDGAYFAPSVCRSEEYPRFCQPYPNAFFYYNCRIHFYGGKSEVKVSVTIENNGSNGKTNPEQYFAPVQSVTLDSVNLELITGCTSPVAVEYDGSAALLSEGESLSVYQNWRDGVYDFENGPYFDITKSGVPLASGKTYPGWISARDDTFQVSVAMRHFWQNFPKALRATPSGIDVGLWPREGEYPRGSGTGHYLFDGGRHKTYELAFDFSAKIADEGAGQRLSERHESPLIALAPMAWYADSGALGMIAPSGLSSNDGLTDEAIKRYDDLQRANVYEKFSENNLTVNSIKTTATPHWEFTKQDRFFGWMNFGDLMWQTQAPCNLHYDWPYIMFLHFLRTGDRAFFDTGVEMVTHRYDIDQYHGDRTDTKGNHKYINYFQFYESSGHADPALAHSPSRVAPPTHTWNGGLTLYYLLTGDRKAWEAAALNAQGAMNYYGPGGLKDAGRPACPNHEIRYEGWSILVLLNAYRVNGKQAYLETALNIATNRLLYREEQIGSLGHWGRDGKEGDADCRLAGCSACSNTELNTFFSYIIDPLIQVHYETGNEHIRGLVLRMADFSKDSFLFGGLTGNDGTYLPLQSSYLWVDEYYDPAGTDGEIIKDIFFADLFAYAFLVSDNAPYLDWAQRCFKDAVFYYDTGGGYVDPDYRSRISFVDAMFPNSHTKAHSWLGRAGQVFLHTQTASNETGFPEIVTDAMPDGAVGCDYAANITVQGGSLPYAFFLDGALPAGLDFYSSGNIEGQPVNSGTFSFTVTVTDAQNNSDTKTYTLTIAPSVDSDGDGLSDEEESTVYGTDPLKVDTDQDGLDDYQECDHWGSEWSTDVDEDGLINLLDPDSDNDGMRDGHEVEAGTDPADSSSVPTSAPTGDTVIETIEDTTISSYSQNEKETNLGGSSHLRIWSDGVRQILLWADTSGIPASAEINRADLRLFCHELRWPAADPVLWAYRVTQAWNEGTSSWYEQPNGATWYE